MIDTLPLPSAPDTEKLVLGAALMDPELMHSVRGVVVTEDFSLDKHRRIWGHACDLYDAGKIVDRVTVYDAVKTAGDADAIGGLGYLISLDEGIPHVQSIGSWVTILRDKSILRKIMGACFQMTKRCSSGVETPQELLEAMGRIALTLAPTEPSTGLQSCSELVDQIGLTTLLQPRKERGIMSPWPWINAMTYGFLPSELWVLAGHTSTGKTSAMLQLAVHVARQGKGVAVFSLEVGKQSLFQKAVWQLSRVDSEKAKRGTMSAEERTATNRAVRELIDMPLYFDTQSTTTMAIHSSIRRRRLKSPVDLVIVDYLQLLGNTGRYDNRAQAVGANAWALKMLATEFQVPVLLLSQFSRASGKTGQQRKPELGDLKESGDIENHANGVWFIHREQLEDAEQVPVEFSLPKQRDGRRNVSTPMYFFPRFQRFEEVYNDETERN